MTTNTTDTLDRGRAVYPAPDPATIPSPAWAESVDEFTWVGLPDVWRRQAARRFGDDVILWAWQEVNAQGRCVTTPAMLDVLTDEALETPREVRELAERLVAAADALASAQSV